MLSTAGTLVVRESDSDLRTRAFEIMTRYHELSPILPSSRVRRPRRGEIENWFGASQLDPGNSPRHPGCTGRAWVPGHERSEEADDEDGRILF